MSLSIRECQEETERNLLSPRAALSSSSRGRINEELPCTIRTCYQRDRDRIIHCKAFRRLKHKTQVFLAPAGDHYRTRLTHTLEVAQIARTIARALRLNEDLTEAIALAHDLGHTPFGHAGEIALKKIVPRGFNHYEQSLRVVEVLEQNGKGLNLTYEVRDGIVKHSKGENEIIPDRQKRAVTLEGDIVRISDIIGYVNHDIDDAVRAGFITENDIPSEFIAVLGDRHSERINRLVKDVIKCSLDTGLNEIVMSGPMLETLSLLRDFLHRRVYHAPELDKEFSKVENIIMTLYEHILMFPGEYLDIPSGAGDCERLAVDFVAGMTDHYAIRFFSDLRLPCNFT